VDRFNSLPYFIVHIANLCWYLCHNIAYFGLNSCGSCCYLWLAADHLRYLDFDFTTNYLSCGL
jgi:hypothetical protein